jgi:hypothetical protein
MLYKLRRWIPTAVIVVIAATFPQAAYADLPASIYQNTPYGDVIGACGYAVNLGQYGYSGYTSAVNYGSGSGCAMFQLDAYTSGGGHDYDYFIAPAQSSWKQVDLLGTWTRSDIYVQDSSCYRLTKYATYLTNQALRTNSSTVC